MDLEKKLRARRAEGCSPAIPFNRRCDSSDSATDDRRYVYLYTFGYRVEPLGSPTLAAGKTSYVAFGCRAESPGSPTPSLRPPSRSWFSNRAKSSGSPTVADGSAGQKAISASEPDEKRRHSCFNDPGREAPVRFADLHRREFLSQRQYSLL